MADQLVQVGELPLALLMGVLGVVMLFDAVPLFGVLVPGDVVVLAAVALGNPTTGVATFVATVTGCLAGWSLSFLVGRRWGDQLRHSRFGGWVGEDRWVAAERILLRNGGRLVLVAPFLPVFNALLPLAAGGLHMSYRRFLCFAALGAAAWAGLYLVAGTASRSVAGLLPAGASPLPFTMVGGLLVAAAVLLGTRRRLRKITD
ncbi:DedA family protein [Micromonospora radicis]|uniref:DedA family protein n=1 Tax=Micromonospora radicis TaxID=1894971 RepID=A0A418MSC6_9ACTN|nr:VTT domain-containing protein [Micromonospora radicis]RIV36908.1 DedA family protein [Micromonospora radicis]